ncbi:alpha-tectorin-like [Anolis sagrei]|uniref:alpha-tectorin-like n=1 Tax=Anolis sagrei TaxID=38937 RepID=UPI00352225A3
MKICLTVLLLLVGSALPSPVREDLPNGDVMYPYGEAEGDQKTPIDDDGTSPEIHMSKPFEYFGKNYTSCYVNNNGVVSFDEPVAGYTPKGIPLADGKAFVAPYWGDVNNELGGDVWYRQTKDPATLNRQRRDTATLNQQTKDLATLNRITKDINMYFPDSHFNADWAMIATWHHVAYYGSRSNKTNTFQCILTRDKEKAFVILNYGDIQWTTGTASGGNSKTGLGGTPAQAGFNTGDNENYYSIPGSRSAHILNIINTSNVGVEGCWAFQVNNFTATGVSEELQKLIPPVEPEPEPEPEAPVEEEPQSPEEEPQTPMEEPQSPEEEPQTPMEEPQSPEEEPQTPMEEPQSPEEEPQIPMEEPQSPEEEPQTPIEEPQAPEEKPQTTVEEPSAPVEEPPASVEEEPEDPFVEEEPEDSLYDDDDDYYYDDDEDYKTISEEPNFKWTLTMS